ncbi:MAG: radical SAM protein, partial [Candidatus Omnitrophica bacterium]|nr:radical SAM protein [Candidatus Omnitrophota bacterium]
SQTPRIMDFNNFINICQGLKPAIQIAQVFNLSSSESLLHPRTFDMIDFVKGINPKIQIAIMTNGMLLNDKIQEELLKRGINSIEVSMDGATKETFESIRVGSDFELIKSNVKSFIKKGGKVRSIFVSRKNNINELLDFVDLASELGIWRIKVTGINTYKPEHTHLALYSYEGDNAVESIFREVETKAQGKHILLTYKGLKINPSACCGLSWTLYCGIDGDISPCVFFSEPSPLSLMDKTRMTEKIVWGNVLKENVLDIWRSDDSLDFRRDLMNGKNCELCGMKYGVIC